MKCSNKKIATSPDNYRVPRNDKANKQNDLSRILFKNQGSSQEQRMKILFERSELFSSVEERSVVFLSNRRKS